MTADLEVTWRRGARGHPTSVPLPSDEIRPHVEGTP